jgi:hypothetical protein
VISAGLPKVCNGSTNFLTIHPFHAEGNRRLRQIIALNVSKYTSAKTKSEKGQVIVDIVEQLQKDSPTGVGFVKPNPKNGKWAYIGTERAKDKIGHALRKAAQEREKKQGSGGKKRKQPQLPSVPISASADNGGGKGGDMPSAKRSEASHRGNGNPYINNAMLESARTSVEGTNSPPPRHNHLGAAFTHQSAASPNVSSNSGWDPSDPSFMAHLRADASLPMTHSPYGYPHLGYPVSPTMRGVGSGSRAGGPVEQQSNFDFPASALHRQQGIGEMGNGVLPTSPTAAFLFSSASPMSINRRGARGGGVYQQSQQHQEQPSPSPYPLQHDQQQQQQLAASIRYAYPSLAFGPSNVAPDPYPQQRYNNFVSSHPQPPINMLHMRLRQRTTPAAPDSLYPPPPTYENPAYESLRNATIDNMRRPHEEQRRPEKDHVNPLYYSSVYGYSPALDPRGGWRDGASKLKHQQDENDHDYRMRSSGGKHGDDS